MKTGVSGSPVKSHFLKKFLKSSFRICRQNVPVKPVILSLKTRNTPVIRDVSGFDETSISDQQTCVSTSGWTTIYDNLY